MKFSLFLLLFLCAYSSDQWMRVTGSPTGERISLVKQLRSEIRITFSPQTSIKISVSPSVGGEEKCSQESAEVCVDSLLSTLLEGAEEEEVCNELRQATECLRSEVEECLGDDWDEEVEEGLQSLENILEENCMDSGTGKECSLKKAEECVDSLLSVLLVGEEAAAVCRELRQATDCLRSEVDNCLGDDHQDEDVEEGLQSLENILKENCQDSEDDELGDVEECIEETKGMNPSNECIKEKSKEFKDTNNNATQCILYFDIVECFLGRVEERCGEEAYNVTLEKIKTNVPEHIKEACKAADLHGRIHNTEDGELDDIIHSIHLFGDDRKKK